MYAKKIAYDVDWSKLKRYNPRQIDKIHFELANGDVGRKFPDALYEFDGVFLKFKTLMTENPISFRVIRLLDSLGKVIASWEFAQPIHLCDVKFTFAVELL